MKRENILIVEDDSVFREMVYDMVKTLGYDCSLAKDGIEALKIIKNERFSLLITDLLMPEMDGIELMKEAKKIFPNLWIIAMTGYALEYPFEKIIESGASDYIKKPFTFKEFEIKLLRAIREKELINELTVLNQINILFASSNRIENILEEALNIFMNGFGYLSCILYLKEEKAEIFEYKNILKAHEKLLPKKHIRIEKDNRISLISKDGEFLFIPDVTGDKEYLKNNELAKSAVLVPIKIGNEVVAGLNVESEIVNGFNEQDIERIRSFANQISIALENFFLQLQTQQERDKFLDLYNNAPFGYHSLNSKGMFLDINDTELGWLGYSREELTGEKHFFEIVTPESYKNFSRNFQKLIKSGYIHDIELELIRKDNTTFPVLLNARALYDRKGNFIKSRASILDITQRKLAEHEINGMRNILETTQNNLDIGLCTLDLDLCVIQLNSWMKKHYPWIEVGKVCYTSFGDKKEPCPWCPVIKCFKSGKTERSDAMIESPNSRQYLNFIASPIRDRKGEITGAVETIIDITEQKMVEERIEFLANIITESKAAIVGVDLKGNITLFNRGA
ncbi:MAG: PAS domain S-box protein [Acidobacteriota bacterium]